MIYNHNDGIKGLQFPRSYSANEGVRYRLLPELPQLHLSEHFKTSNLRYAAIPLAALAIIILGFAFPVLRSDPTSGTLPARSNSGSDEASSPAAVNTPAPSAGQSTPAVDSGGRSFFAMPSGFSGGSPSSSPSPAPAISSGEGGRGGGGDTPTQPTDPPIDIVLPPPDPTPPPPEPDPLLSVEAEATLGDQTVEVGAEVPAP